jgi:hypothetical protein
MNIGIINELPKGTPVDYVDGHIVNLYPRKAGTSASGKDWSFQNGEMQIDGSTIKLKFSFCEEIPQSWRGKKVRLASTATAKGRTGLYADDEEYNGTTTRILRATNSHQLLDLAEAAQPGAAAPAPAASPTPSATRPATSPTPAAPAAAPHDFLSAVKQRIAKIAALQSICYDAAAHNAHRIFEHHGIALVPGAVGCMADKIFMEAIRRTDVDSMPLDPYAAKPFKGRPLDELLPHMRHQIGEGKAEIEVAETEAKQHLTQPVAQPQMPVDEPAADDTMPF